MAEDQRAEAVQPADEPRCRPPNIGDALILIAVIAPGLALQRTYFDELRHLIGNYRFLVDNLGHPLTESELCRSFIGFGWSLLLPLSIGQIILRLRRPRPALRLALLQPGTAAAVSTTAATILFLPPLVISVYRLPPRYVEAMLWAKILSWMLYPTAVALVWIGLVGLRRWRTEMGWIDCMGIVLGMAWIATAPIAIYLAVALLVS